MLCTSSSPFRLAPFAIAWAAFGPARPLDCWVEVGANRGVDRNMALSIETKRQQGSIPSINRWVRIDPIGPAFALQQMVVLVPPAPLLRLPNKICLRLGRHGDHQSHPRRASHPLIPERDRTEPSDRPSDPLMNRPINRLACIESLKTPVAAADPVGWIIERAITRSHLSI